MSVNENLSNVKINPNVLDGPDGQPIFKDDSATYGKVPSRLLVDGIMDKDWAKTTFMVKSLSLDEVDKKNRFWSTADLKFGDTSLGGSLACNARPQFTVTTDVRSKGRRLNRNDVNITSTSGNYGMGRLYSEKLDDNFQSLFLEFGVPEFNSIFSFFTRSIDYATSVIANTGRSPVAYYAGLGLGSVAAMIAFPLASVFIYGTKFVSSLVGDQEPFSYYYIKPTMHTYWSTVNTIVTTIATELGLVIPEFMSDGTTADRIGIPVKLNEKDMEFLREMMPGMITNNNYIDVFAIATKAQALANEQMLAEKRLFDEGKLSNDDFLGYVKTPFTTYESNAQGEGLGNLLNEVLSVRTVPTSAFESRKTVNSYETFLDGFKSDSGEGAYDFKDEKIVTETKTEESSTVNMSDVGTPPTTIYDENGTIEKSAKEKEAGSTYFDSVAKAFDSAVRGGGQYAVFNVDYVGTVNESFSNSVTDVPAGEMIRSVSSKSRSVKFSLGGGQMLGDTVTTALGYVKDFAAGTLEGLTFGLSNVIPTLLGGGYINVPKMWDDSDVTLPKITYNMQLISPYNNPISMLRNVYIPLAMIMAGAMPLSTGPASYTSPFLCRSYLKGLQKINLGMITDLSITRGTSNLGYDSHGKALAFDVSFTITDFSSMLAAPVNSGMFGAFKAAFNDGSTFNNYISTICARDLMSTKYAVPKAKIRLSRMMHGAESIMSPSFIGMRAGSSLTGVIGAFVADTQLNLLHKQ